MLQDVNTGVLPIIGNVIEGSDADCPIDLPCRRSPVAVLKRHLCISIQLTYI